MPPFVDIENGFFPQDLIVEGFEYDPREENVEYDFNKRRNAVVSITDEELEYLKDPIRFCQWKCN